MDHILRKAYPSDKIGIEKLFVEMLKAIYRNDDVEGYEAGHLDKFFSDNEDLIYVAEHENDVVAFLSIEVYRDENFVYLDDLSVTKAYRNKGIGTSLILAAEKYAKDIGIKKIVFHVEKTNTDAYRLYSRLGYSKEADEENRIRMYRSIG